MDGDIQSHQATRSDGLIADEPASVNLHHPTPGIAQATTSSESILSNAQSDQQVVSSSSQAAPADTMMQISASGCECMRECAEHLEAGLHSDATKGENTGRTPQALSPSPFLPIGSPSESASKVQESASGNESTCQSSREPGQVTSPTRNGEVEFTDALVPPEPAADLFREHGIAPAPRQGMPVPPEACIDQSVGSTELPAARAALPTVQRPSSGRGQQLRCRQPSRSPSIEATDCVENSFPEQLEPPSGLVEGHIKQAAAANLAGENATEVSTLKPSLGSCDGRDSPALEKPSKPAASCAMEARPAHVPKGPSSVVSELRRARAAMARNPSQTPRSGRAT